jgi:hypothetical protein
MKIQNWIFNFEEPKPSSFKAPELIVPARSHATLSRQVKQLSDIDDQPSLRFQVPLIFFYKNNPSMEGKDPIKVIKEAISRTLVFYYPLAGRLREGFNRKLMVDCTDEGVMFTEADANLKLDQLGDHEIQPPSPYLDQLLPSDDPIIGRPLMSFQVSLLIFLEALIDLISYSIFFISIIVFLLITCM